MAFCFMSIPEFFSCVVLSCSHAPSSSCFLKFHSVVLSSLALYIDLSNPLLIGVACPCESLGVLELNMCPAFWILLYVFTLFGWIISLYILLLGLVNRSRIVSQLRHLTLFVIIPPVVSFWPRMICSKGWSFMSWLEIPVHVPWGFDQVPVAFAVLMECFVRVPAFSQFGADWSALYCIFNVGGDRVDSVLMCY